MAGYAFARFSFPFKKILFGVVILMIILPPQTLIMPNYLQYRFFDFGGVTSLFGYSINLLDTPYVFVIPAMFAAGLKAGLFIFIFRQFFSGLPKELSEAARIDGCGAFTTFLKVMVPCAVPAFITVLLFSFIWYWNEYYSSAMFFAGEIRPLTVMLNSLGNRLALSGQLDPSTTPFQSRMYMQAGALMTIAPLLILYMFTQKYFTESIERTGIVG
jgi:multiple sugar transport system permease protein